MPLMDSVLRSLPAGRATRRGWGCRRDVAPSRDGGHSATPPEGLASSRSTIRTLKRLVVGVALALFTVVVMRTAWLTDDAFITFRTIDNLVNGHGLTWNVAERVQAYTHPLWMLLMSAAYAATGEIVVTAMTVSVVLSTLAAAVLGLGISRTGCGGLFAVGMLVFSRPFVDYSTSGLEAPLTHLLLGLFLLAFFRPEQYSRRLGTLSLLAGLLACNRMDTLLLVLPAIVWAWWGQRSWRSAGRVVLGFLPLLAWLAFSLAYYGFPFPNTAYAKLATGIPAGDLAIQGLWYVVNLATHDPLTCVVLVVGLAAPVLGRNPRSAVVAAGVLLYCLYIIRIGGDFMSGRLFTPPMFVAIAVLVTDRASIQGHGARRWRSAAALATIILLGLATPRPTVLSGADFGRDPTGYLDSHGIGDERRFYYQSTGLLLHFQGVEVPRHPWVDEGKSYRALNRSMIVVRGSVGFLGFYAGPKVHIVDFLALTDPLLARLPAAFDPNWRIGHFVRNVPSDYLHAVTHGPGALSDPDLRLFVEALWTITRGPIWSRERWRTILDFNLGRYDHLVDQDTHRFADMLHVSSRSVARPSATEGARDGPGGVVIGRGGLHVALPSRTFATEIEMEVDGRGAYRLLLMDRARVIQQTTVNPRPATGEGVAVFTVRVNSRAARRGYTGVRIFPVDMTRRCRLHYLSVGNE